MSCQCTLMSLCMTFSSNNLSQVLFYKSEIFSEPFLQISILRYLPPNFHCFTDLPPVNDRATVMFSGLCAEVWSTSSKIFGLSCTIFCRKMAHPPQLIGPPIPRTPSSNHIYDIRGKSTIVLIQSEPTSNNL